MGSFSENTLRDLRSQGQALADLVEKFNRTGINNPRLPMLARMIRQLTEEIVLQRTRATSLGRAPPAVDRRSAALDAELGLC
jgi:hypothetical protein